MTGQCGPSSSGLKSIEFARRGDAFLINTSDRVIRVYDSKEIITLGKDGEPEPIQKLQDLVNKTTWKKCCFSGDMGKVYWQPGEDPAWHQG
ncbi:retinoblastoma-binding protein 5 homolog [Drosophila simulans]|uniref:retinoblastoma-binding protein 5 homolog n=1 Tax=Drosophila simulans TaxID=7240 RepID=UPI00192CED2A|nr:retinoblastoma-binding protein 5 homolog [Drosophila simulans]